MVVDSSPHAIIATDVDRTVRLWNPAAERLYGWRADEIVGRNVVEVLVPEPMLSDANSILATVESGGAWSGTFSVRHKDGTMVRAVVSNRRLLDGDGAPIGIVGESRVLPDDEGADRPEALLLWLDDALGTTGLDGVAHVDPESQAPLLAAEHSARVAAELAAARLAGLQAVTAALSRALDRSEVADAVFHHGLRQLGGHTASLCLLAPAVTDQVGGRTVDIVHAIGYSEAVTRSWRSFPLDAALPASEAIRTGELVLLRSRAESEERFPLPPEAPRVGDQAHAIMPLPDEDGVPFGALVVGFAQPRDFGDDDIALLRALGTQCAGALRRATLFETTRASAEAEQAARRAAEEAQHDLAFLAEASAVLASSLDHEATITRVAELAVPHLADWCAVFLTSDTGAIRPVAVAHVDPARVDVIRHLLDRYPPTDPSAAASSVGAVLPLQAGGRVLGVLALGNDRGRPLSEASLALGVELAVRAGVAVDNARLFTERTRIARQLQASLLPSILPTIPGLDVGARYAAASEAEEVGGDFYDVFGLDDGRWAVVVGDVRGKGVEAAAITGVARHTIRSASLHMQSPRALLSHLNEVLLRSEADRYEPDRFGPDRFGPDRFGPDRFGPGGSEAMDAVHRAWALDEPRFCTVGLAVMEPADDGVRVTVCVAGHPLPLVARADGRVETMGGAGTLLGVTRDVDLRDVTVHLGPGDSLVSFTDGIVERHDGRHFFEEEGVAAVLRATCGLAADVVAAAVEDAARHFVEGAPRDDMAVVVVRVPGGRRRNEG